MWNLCGLFLLTLSVLQPTEGQNYSCDYTIIGSSRYIDSPNYPSNYPNNSGCTWTLDANPGYKIHLTRVAFAMEKPNDQKQCIWDYLEAYNNGTELIGKYCGNNFPPMITTSGTSLKMVFRSNVNVTGTGFRIRVESVLVRCGLSLFTTSSGLMASPNYPSNYANNANCTWKLGALPTNKVIRLTFIEMSLQQPNAMNVCLDFLQVFYGKTRIRLYSASSHGAVLIHYMGSSTTIDDLRLEDFHMITSCFSKLGTRSVGKFCGNKFPPLLMSSENTMNLQFTSDSSVNQKGFIVRYEMIDRPYSCPSKYITNSIGQLESPNFPSNYPNNAWCSWTLTATTKQVVQIKFLNISLQSGNSCIDYVELFDGETKSLGQFCDSTALARSVKSTGRLMTVVFSSDSSVSNSGFRLEYKYVASTARSTHLVYESLIGSMLLLIFLIF